MTLSLYPFFTTMWTASPQPASSPPPGHTAQGCSLAVAVDGDNCQKDACRRDNSSSSSSISLSPTLWEPSQAQEARALVSSMERRQAQLLKLMQVHSHYKMNPLGSAMSAEYAYRIHQIALLINGQITQLRRMVGECEQRLTRSASTQSRSSSLADWEEIHALSNSGGKLAHGNNNNDDDDDGLNSALCAKSPPANNLTTIRYRLLTDVIAFFANEFAHIKTSLVPTTDQQHSHPDHENTK
ncbi:hypothetical protein GGI20_004032 [Coemansia sp. BCRC 34301]|nr:hypothetical protein GGI20_004032 [Coemansia sp. BCRC 34301]